MDKILTIVFFVILALLLTATGVVFRKKSGTLRGFVAADRSFSFFTGAFSSASASLFGYGVIVLLSLAYTEGAEGGRRAVFYGAALTVGLYLAWRFSARRLRVYSELSSDSLTLPAFLESRFKDKTPTIRIASSAVLFLFVGVYCSFLFTAAARLLSFLTGFTYGTALLLCAATVIIYLAFGGMYAAAFSDILQGFFLLIVILFLPVYIFSALDAGSRLAFENEVLQTLDLFKNGEGLGINLINSVFMAVGCFGSPLLFSRFISMRDKKQIKRGGRAVIFPCVMCVVLCVVVGLFLRQLPLPEGATAAEGLALLIADPFMRALTVSALLAAMFSSAAGLLLLLASTGAGDIYPLFRRRASDEEKTTVARAAAIVFTLFVCLASLDGSVDVFSRFIQGFSGFASSFAPTLFFSLYSRRITLRAAVASILTGAATEIVFWFIPLFGGRIMSLCLCLSLSAAVLWLVSLFDRKKPGKDILNEFARVNEIMGLR